ncbi:MAG: hypothetical protein U9R72_07645 [Chloroflexota bacterium]|nr:hypothetical protein [Chloroflexota bacterium]
MADISIWQDSDARAAFIAKGKEVLEAIKGDLDGREDAVVVAIEPESGDYFVGKTLGQADRAAFEEHPDEWIYFVRVEDPDAAIPLPAW